MAIRSTILLSTNLIANHCVFDKTILSNQLYWIFHLKLQSYNSNLVMFAGISGARDYNFEIIEKEVNSVIKEYNENQVYVY